MDCLFKELFNNNYTINECIDLLEGQLNSELPDIIKTEMASCEQHPGTISEIQKVIKIVYKQSIRNQVDYSTQLPISLKLSSL